MTELTDPDSFPASAGTSTSPSRKGLSAPGIPRSLSIPNSPSKSLVADLLAESHIDDLLDEFDRGWRCDLEYLRRFAAAKQIDMYSNAGEIAGELTRVDLDRRYACGAAVALEDYVRLFPMLADSPQALTGVAFEDYRARQTRGLSIEWERWRSLPAIESQSWYRELLYGSLENYGLANGSVQFVDSIAPTSGPGENVPGENVPGQLHPGGRFGDFELVQLLGTGAFSQVYLARQLSLAGRFVALKIVRQQLQEPSHLARLQHTGIVPLYSLHRIGEYSALCMPYCGATTLADWFSVQHVAGSARLRDGHSFVETVEASNGRPTMYQATDVDEISSNVDSTVTESLRVWNAAGTQPLHGLRGLTTREFAVWFSHRLASALAHAHARGIVHGDIKPANVLIRNDGEPALIDFNLAHSDTTPTPQIVGGTLPYMAPEQLESLVSRRAMTSAASDVYSLGVLLYELIEGKLPFPVPLSMSETDLSAAINDRRDRSLTWQSKGVAPGLRSIITKCLAHKPAARYATAEALLLDVEREKQHLPLLHAPESLRSKLSKLNRRFPRLFSGGAIAGLAGLMIFSLALAVTNLRQRSGSLAATKTVYELHELAAAAPLRALDQEKSSWEGFHQSSMGDLRRLLKLRADQSLTETETLRWLSEPERTLASRLLFEHALVMSTLWFENASRNNASTDEASEVDPQLNHWLPLCGQFPELASQSTTYQLLRQLSEHSAATQTVEMPVPATPLEALLLARIALYQNRTEAAASLLKPLPEESPFKALFWLTLGQIDLNEREYDSARITLSLASAAAPACAVAFRMRAEAAAGKRDFESAVADYSRAVVLSSRKAGTLADRARMHEMGGNLELALADANEALQLEPGSNRLLVYRSRLNQRLGRTSEAQADFQAALKLVPKTEVDWVSRGLARASRDPHGALADLQQALLLNPRSTMVLQNIASIQSDKLHDDVAAVDSLSTLLAFAPSFELARSGRCVLYARLGKTEQALDDVSFLQSIPTPLPSSIYAVACTFSLLSQKSANYCDDAFHYLTDATLSGGYGRELLDTDPDLEPIREEPRFVKLAEFIRILDENAEHVAD